MNKSDLVDAIAASAGLTKVDADRALKAFMDVVMQQLAKGEKINIVGFGTFEKKRRSARTGRNPKTGEVMQIAEAVTAGFKPGKLLKDAIASADKA
ncbi:MAG: DNA-binding protein HU [Legionellaceae bacterium]